MNKYLTVAVIVGVFVANQASLFGAGVNSLAVIPGQRLGPVKLGSSKTTVHKMMGPPYIQRSDGSLKFEYFHVSRSDKNHYLSVIYKHGKVIQIETDAPRFRTAQGISAASALGQIRRKSGKWRIVSFGQNDPDPDIAEHAQHFYDDMRQGLAFELDLGSQADTSSEVVPGSLIVHPAGHPVEVPE